MLDNFRRFFFLRLSGDTTNYYARASFYAGKCSGKNDAVQFSIIRITVEEERKTKKKKTEKVSPDTEFSIAFVQYYYYTSPKCFTG